MTAGSPCRARKAWEARPSPRPWSRPVTSWVGWSSSPKPLSERSISSYSRRSAARAGWRWAIAHRYKQLTRRLAERTALQQVAQVVNRRLELGPLLEEIVRQVSDVLGYPIVGIFLIAGDELVLRAAHCP